MPERTASAFLTSHATTRPSRPAGIVQLIRIRNFVIINCALYRYSIIGKSNSQTRAIFRGVRFGSRSELLVISESICWLFSNGAQKFLGCLSFPLYLLHRHKYFRQSCRKLQRLSSICSARKRKRTSSRFEL